MSSPVKVIQFRNIGVWVWQVIWKSVVISARKSADRLFYSSCNFLRITRNTAQPGPRQYTWLFVNRKKQTLVSLDYAIHNNEQLTKKGSSRHLQKEYLYQPINPVSLHDQYFHQNLILEALDIDCDKSELLIDVHIYLNLHNWQMPHCTF